MAKAGGNYLSSQLMIHEARRHGYGEAVALDAFGYLSEGAAENLFLVRDERRLHAADRGGAAAGDHPRHHPHPRPPPRLRGARGAAAARSALLADEVFMTGTASEITPVRSVDGLAVGAGLRGPVTRRLQEAFFGLFDGQHRGRLGLARADSCDRRGLKPAFLQTRCGLTPGPAARCSGPGDANLSASAQTEDLQHGDDGRRRMPAPARRAYRPAAIRRSLARGLGARCDCRVGLADRRIEPRVDNLDELLGACERKREEALDRNREVDAWVAYKAGLGEDVSKQAAKGLVPACDSAAISARLGSTTPAVWAMTTADGGLLYATVNLPLPAILVSADGGHSWHYRHLFLGGYNVERALMLRGIAFRDGLLAVASDSGVLLSADGGLSFDHALPASRCGRWRSRPQSGRRLVAGGDGTSFLSADGGATWSDLAFSRFTRSLATHNPHRIDHITSAAFDP
jgi:hypothetical protein